MDKVSRTCSEASKDSIADSSDCATLHLPRVSSIPSKLAPPMNALKGSSTLCETLGCVLMSSVETLSFVTFSTPMSSPSPDKVVSSTCSLVSESLPIIFICTEFCSCSCSCSSCSCSCSCMFLMFLSGFHLLIPIILP